MHYTHVHEQVGANHQIIDQHGKHNLENPTKLEITVVEGSWFYRLPADTRVKRWLELSMPQAQDRALCRLVPSLRR